jgi:hypothetical protein
MMMNSEVGIVPVAAVCHRLQTNPKNPTECRSAAAFVRKPQLERITPTLRSPLSSVLSSVLSTVALAKVEVSAKAEA